MFGRLDENTEFEREYLVVSDFIDEDPLVFALTVSPGEAKEAIRTEIETYRDVSFSIYELVEHAVVEKGREVVFTEDWATIAEEDDGPEDS